MINIKTGTKTFSDNQMKSSFDDQKQNTLSALEKEKMLGGQEVGDYLNKIVDPNWVDPSKVRKGAGDADLDKDAFFKLLLTQLKNQDPTTPLKSHEMAAQLAQFSSLEQLNNINSGIEGLSQAQKPTEQYGALNMIGKAVQGDSGKFYRSNLEDEHEINFNLHNAAAKIQLDIKDVNGQVVKKLEFNNFSKGKNEITWNGMLDDGSKARQGDYTVDVVAMDNEGKKIAATTEFKGKISGVNFTAQGPVLMIGNKSVKLSDIKEIIDPSQIKNEDINKVNAQQTEAAAQKIDGVNQSAGSLDDVAMSREVVNKVKQSGANTSAR